MPNIRNLTDWCPLIPTICFLILTLSCSWSYTNTHTHTWAQTNTYTKPNGNFFFFNYFNYWCRTIHSTQAGSCISWSLFMFDLILLSHCMYLCMYVCCFFLEGGECVVIAIVIIIIIIITVVIMSVCPVDLSLFSCLFVFQY